MKKPVFYSFHYARDVMRVQQVRNIGVLDGNAPANPNQWEMIKRQGEVAVRNWIDENMRYKRCVVVLVGSETAQRPWVQYEIRRAWETRKGLLGIHIHNLNCPRTGGCVKGNNPFQLFNLPGGQNLSSVIRCYDPNWFDAYGDIARNISSWIDMAVSDAARR